MVGHASWSHQNIEKTISLVLNHGKVKCIRIGFGSSCWSEMTSLWICSTVHIHWYILYSYIIYITLSIFIVVPSDLQGESRPVSSKRSCISDVNYTTMPWDLKTRIACLKRRGAESQDLKSWGWWHDLTVNRCLVDYNVKPPRIMAIMAGHLMEKTTDLCILIVFFCGIPISNSQAVSFWTVSLYSKFQGATLTNKDIVYKSSFPWLKVMQAKWSLPPLQVSWLTCYCCCCCCCCCRT